jgi:hypothetical protein
MAKKKESLEKPVTKKTVKKQAAKKKTETKKKTTTKKSTIAKTPAAKKKTVSKKKTSVKKATPSKKATPAKKVTVAKKTTAKRKTGVKRKKAAVKSGVSRKLVTKKSDSETAPIVIDDSLDAETSKYEMTSGEDVSAPSVLSPQPGPNVPDAYGDSKIVLLIRDPEWVFAYWEINDQLRSTHNIKRGKHNKTMVLRIFDVSGIDFDGTNANRYYDVIVNDYAKSWYLRIPEVNRTWCVELGYYDTSSGDFMKIVASNIVTTPPGTISSYSEEEWMQVNSQLHFEEIIRLSGGLDIMDKPSSEDLVKLISERLRIKIEQSGGASGILCSGKSAPSELK